MIRFIFAGLLTFALPAISYAQWPGSGSANTSQPSGKKFGAFTPGNSATGGDGCYFGECGGSPPDSKPTTTNTPRPGPTGPPPTGSGPIASVSNICQTPAFWCRLFQQGAPGTACYCNVPIPPGYVNGMIVPQQ